MVKVIWCKIAAVLISFLNWLIYISLDEFAHIQRITAVLSLMYIGTS